MVRQAEILLKLTGSEAGFVTGFMRKYSSEELVARLVGDFRRLSYL